MRASVSIQTRYFQTLIPYTLHLSPYIFHLTPYTRWIKYEEDLEAEKGEWGKPHVSSLTFHSMINLRLNIETGTMLLDISVKDFPNLVHRVVEDLSEKGIIEEHMKEKVLRVLLFRHKHVHPHEKTFKFGLRRSMSQRSMQVAKNMRKKGQMIFFLVDLAFIRLER